MRARDEEPLDPRDFGGVPQEEDVDAADAAERVEEDPAEQPNYTDEHPDAIERTVKES